MYNYSANISISKPIDIIKPMKYKKKINDLLVPRSFSSTSSFSPPINLTSSSPNISSNFLSKSINQDEAISRKVFKDIFIEVDSIKNKATMKILLRLSIPVLYTGEIDRIIKESETNNLIFIIKCTENDAIKYCRNLIENGLVAFYQ